MAETTIRYKNSYSKGDYREIFDVSENENKLKVYIKSSLTVYDVVLANEATIEKEEFCASRFAFSVVKDDTVSFNQGDAVSVRYEDNVIFYGYVFCKSRDKEGIISVVAYDQLRYLKNRRSYSRGQMKLDEIVNKIADDNAMRKGDIDSAGITLPSVAADNVSLLDVIVKACSDARRISGKRFIVYDDGGYITLKNEDDLATDVLIDATNTENYLYTDTIDNNVYNMICLYSDTPKANLREITVASDKSSMEKWGTLILSKKAADVQASSVEAANLLEEYNKVQREIVLKNVAGDPAFVPGARLRVQMSMGDLDIDSYVRCRKTVHKFSNNLYTADLYIDGSEIG